MGIENNDEKLEERPRASYQDDIQEERYHVLYKDILLGKRSEVTITVVDRCSACAEYDLDLSQAAFDALADESKGRIPIQWRWAN